MITAQEPLEKHDTRGDTVSLSCAHLRVPPFPEVALKVLRAAGEENVQLARLSDLISSDPAFSAEVLTIANSLLYAPRYPIRSILQAIEVLGARHLQGLCITVGVRGYLGKWLGHPTMRTLWRHNLATALIAEQIASAGTSDRSIAFTAGIMHGVGMLALAVLHPQEYIHLLGTHIGPTETLLEREKGLFGADHGEVAQKLIAEWQLPDEFTPIVSGRHAPSTPDSRWDMTAIVSLSCRMAQSAGYAPFPACHSAPFEDLLEELPRRERLLFHTGIETLGFEISKKIAAVEAS